MKLAMFVEAKMFIVSGKMRIIWLHLLIVLGLFAFLNVTVWNYFLNDKTLHQTLTRSPLQTNMV